MDKNFSYYLSKFLKDYIVIERNLSNNTIRSYKKTFSLLIEYLVNVKNIKLANINFSTVTLDYIIDFLNYLEQEKHNSPRTRNQRFAAIKSFYQYCSIEEVSNINNIRKILSIRDKKTQKKVINYLTEEELKLLFESIDTSTKIGRRDLTLLTLLYDTGARANEIVNLKLEDINFGQKYIILNGKGRKQRVVSMMGNTKDLLIRYINEFNIQSSYLFNNNRKRMGITFIADVIKKYDTVIKDKHITPHVFRHTRAVHLLDHGVNMMYIKELLGHESVSTTQIYATVIEKTKFKAIENATPQYRNENLKDWNDNVDLLTQLLNL